MESCLDSIRYRIDDIVRREAIKARIRVLSESVSWLPDPRTIDDAPHFFFAPSSQYQRLLAAVEDMIQCWELALARWMSGEDELDPLSAFPRHCRLTKPRPPLPPRAKKPAVLTPLEREIEALKARNLPPELFEMEAKRINQEHSEGEHP
jgi:hypothetical protein